MTTYRYEIRTMPGCHGRPEDPVESRTNSIDRAMAAIRRDDRVYVYDTETGESIKPPQRNDPQLGSGRFGAAWGDGNA